MKTEFEVKILDIDVDSIKKKLDLIGAKFILERNMKRFVYDFNPVKENSWIRLRDNGSKVTLTIKEIEHNEIDGTKESEIEVSDFDTTYELLEKLGYKHKGYQENKRISYKIENVEIEIDFWPNIPPYLEIEGPSIEQVKEVLNLLGFTIEQTTSINTQDVYKKYNIDILETKELKF